MLSFFRQVATDLRQRRNLELYLLLLVGGAVLVIDVFDLVSNNNVIGEQVVFNAVLAALLLIAFGMLGDRHSNADISQRLERIEHGPSARSFFRKFSNTPFQDALQSAKMVSFYAVAPGASLSTNEEEIKALLVRGGYLEVLLVDPDGAAARMDAERGPLGRVDDELEYVRKEIEVVTQTLKGFALVTKNRDQVTLKFIDHVPPAIITIIDRHEMNATAFVALSGFGEPFTSRPSFILTKSSDGRWFEFYARTFENLWTWPKCRQISLIS